MGGPLQVPCPLREPRDPSSGPHTGVALGGLCRLTEAEGLSQTRPHPIQAISTGACVVSTPPTQQQAKQPGDQEERGRDVSTNPNEADLICVPESGRKVYVYVFGGRVGRGNEDLAADAKNSSK